MSADELDIISKFIALFMSCQTATCRLLDLTPRTSRRTLAVNVICNTKETLKQIEIIRFSKNYLASSTSFIVTSPPKLTDCRKQSLFYALYSIFCDRSSTFMITNQISYQAEMISEGHLFSCLRRFVRFLIKEVKVLKLTLPSVFLIQKKLN